MTASARHGRPSLGATVRADATGTLSVNGLEYPVSAVSVERLHAGLVARAVAVARTVARPVRLHVTDGAGTRVLTVGPDGVVDEPAAGGAARGVPGESPCRRCGAPQPLAAAACRACATLEPHRVELTPVAVLDAVALTEPEDLRPASVAPSEPLRPAPAAPAGPATRTASPSPVSLPVLAPATPPAPTAPRRSLRLTIDGLGTVEVAGAASLGRDPLSIGGRQPVRLTSPTMTVSKTHAFVDVDEAGTISVTDCASTNGTHVLGPQGVRLPPRQAVVVTPGTALAVGDVTCVVDLGA